MAAMASGGLYKKANTVPAVFRQPLGVPTPQMARISLPGLCRMALMIQRF